MSLVVGILKIIDEHFFCTVKLERAKLPANAGNFTCSSQVKRSHTQFTSVTYSLPVKTGNYTCFFACQKHISLLGRAILTGYSIVSANMYQNKNMKALQ